MENGLGCASPHMEHVFKKKGSERLSMKLTYWEDIDGQSREHVHSAEDVDFTAREPLTPCDYGRLRERRRYPAGWNSKARVALAGQAGVAHLRNKDQVEQRTEKTERCDRGIQDSETERAILSADEDEQGNEEHQEVGGVSGCCPEANQGIPASVLKSLTFWRGKVEQSKTCWKSKQKPSRHWRGQGG